MDGARRNTLRSGPNLLTIIRLLLVPVVGWLLLRESGTNAASRALAAVVYLAASLTDIVDGEWARRTGQVSTFGKIADPIADKALTGVALVSLSILGEMPWWATMIILVREIGVTALRFYVIRDGVIPASRGGKAKTAAQTLAILLYLLPLGDPWASVRLPVLLVAVALTLVTGADYVVRARRLHRAARGGVTA